MDGFDVLVLGGGTAGCVLAARLSEVPDRRVCLVEAGPDYGAGYAQAWPAELLDARSVPDSHDWADADSTLMVARVVGGCSAHNLCFWIHPADADWDEWAAVAGDAGWSAAAMRAHVDRVESVMPLRRFAEGEQNPWLRTCIAAAGEIGVGIVGDVNDHRTITGAGPMPVNCVGTTRWNAAFAYLDPARSRPNLTILDHALVDRVTFDGARAAGARLIRDGDALEVTAALVVLAAGSYGSPAVLLRSGIGPEPELARHGVAARAVLPVGRELRDHFSVRMRFTPSPGMQAAMAEHARSGLTFFSQGIARARSAHAPDDLWDLHLMIGSVMDGDTHVLGLNSALVKPRWTGSVTLRSADPSRLPAVTPQTLEDERDMAAMLDGLELCRALLGSAAARGAWEEQLLPDPALTGEALAAYCAGAVSPYFHPVGTCAMGTVVGPDGAVHGVEGLHVADASVMPIIPRANTNLPVLAAAEAIAARLAAG